jgi:hypothetical protein
VTSTIVAATVAATMTEMITPDEARVLTDRIKDAAEHLWKLLEEARDRKAWQALGYASMLDYAKAEFGMSQSYAYRLFHQARVIHALQESVPDSPMGEIMSERLARQVRAKDVDMIAVEVKQQIEGGATAAEAIQNVIDERARLPCYLNARKRADRNNRIVDATVEDASNLLIAIDRVDFASLDPRCMPEWISTLRSASRELGRLADRLDLEVNRRG